MKMIRRYASNLTKRNPNYSSLSELDLNYFRKVLDYPSGLISSDMESYNSDWLKRFNGNSKLCLRPKTTKQVSEILKYCNERSLSVVPQGGNTGLVGGSVPVFDEIILSTQLMNSIISFDSVSGILKCQAGCVLEQLDQYLEQRSFMMPLDLGAKGSCHIGGNLATNAGGLRLLRYGSLHGSVLGVEAVLADGTILDDMRSLRKDNTGYDLKQLFIGSEGTLGIITSCAILTPTRPKSLNVSLLAVDSFEKVQSLFVSAKTYLSEILSAFEFFDSTCLELVKNNLNLKVPLDSNSKFFVLIETSGSSKSHDDEKIESFLERMMNDNIVLDGIVSQDSTQFSSIWKIREGIPEACARAGSVYKYDLSVPVSKLYDIVDIMTNRIKDRGLLGNLVKSVVGYGHVGDGNLHLNIVSDGFQQQITDVIEPFVYEWISSVNGSISAEHGLGQMKKDYIGYSKSPALISLMKTLKNTLDPNHILNPYKFFP